MVSLHSLGRVRVGRDSATALQDIKSTDYEEKTDYKPKT
jgi:hypothetical protein